MIKLLNVNKSFKYRKLYHEVNLEIPSSSISFIIGQSGSGKTTLINLIGGLEKTDSGKITFDLNGKKLDLQKNKNPFLVDYVFQDFNLFNDLTVLDNLKVAKKLLGSKWDKNKTIENLKTVGLTENILQLKASELSGGEQQRLAIFRSIEKGSEILLVDEPTGNLDIENSENILKLLKELSKTKTIIVVTHDVESAWKYGDNIFEIENQNVLTLKSKQKYEIIENKISDTFSKNKSSLKSKLGAIYTFTKADLRKKKITFLLVSITTFLTVVTLLFSFFFVLGIIDVDTRKISSGNLDVLSISKKSVITDRGFVRNEFTDEENKKIKNYKDIKEVVDVDNISHDSQFIFDGRTIKKTSEKRIPIEEIENNDFFKNRLASNGLTGEIVKNINEIIIGKSIADQINDANLIGKNIDLDIKVDGFPVKTLKIVGINNSKRFDGEYINYTYKGFFSQPLVLKDKVTFRPLGVGGVNSNRDKDLLNLSLPKFIDNSEKITSGSGSMGLNKLLISNTLVEMWKLKNVNIKLDSEFLLSYLNEKERNLEVSGIFESNVPELRISKETFDDIFKNEILAKRIYIRPDANLEKIIKELGELDSNFEVTIPYSEVFFELFLGTSIPTTVFQFLFSILLIVAIVSFSTMSLILTKSKKRDMMIMKTLGAKLWQIVYYSFGSFFVIMLFVLVAFAISAFAISPLYTYLTLGSNDFLTIYYDRLVVWIIIMWLSTFILFSLVYLIASFLTNSLSYRKMRR